MKLHLQFALSFNGHCEAAFRRYERCLNGTITFMVTWGNSPAAAEAPPEWGAKIYHATLKVGDTVIMGGDFPPDRYEPPKGFELVLQMDDPIAAERVFKELGEGGTVQMPLQETAWASKFGVLVDPFGVRWSVNCERAVEPTS
jgi:PhnB protein